MGRNRRHRLIALLGTLVVVLGLLQAVAATEASAAFRPRITSVAPTTVKTTGGARVTIRGTGFRKVRQVLIGGKRATGVRVISRQRISAVVPRHDVGWKRVRVVTRAGWSSASAVARIRYVPPPPPPPPPPTPEPVTVLPVRDLVATAGEHTVTLEWPALTTVATGIQVRRASGGQAPRTLVAGATVATLPASATTVTDTGLADGHEYSYAVFVTMSGSVSVPRTTSVRTQLTMPSGWSQPRSIVRPTAGRILDCLAPEHCVAVDRLGNATEYDGATWSRPVKIDTSPDDYWHTGFRFLDCASASFCLAIDTSVGSRTFDGSSWHGRVPVYPRGAAEPAALSCGSPTFCVLVTNGATSYVFDGATWSGAISLPPPPAPAEPGPVQSLDCTPTTCLAIDAAGRSRQFANRTWSVPVQAIGSPYVPHETDVSCVRSTWCMVADRSLRPRIWNGSMWFDGPDLPGNPADGLHTLTCLADDFCLRSAGGSLVYDGTSWGRPPEWDSTFPSLWEPRCDPTGAYCLSPSRNGDPDQWADPRRGDHGATASYAWQSAPSAVSCPTATYCQAFGRGSVEMEGNSWGEPQPFPHPGDPRDDSWAGGTPDAFDCPAAGRCMLVGGNTNMGARWWTFDAAGWSQRSTMDTPAELTAVSCPTITRCVATTRHHIGGAAVTTWNGGSWSAFTKVAPDDEPGQSDLEGISCPTTTFCAAVGGLSSATYPGQAVVWRALSGWSAPAYRGHLSYLGAVGCTTAPSCVAVGPRGATLEYDAGTWGQIEVLDGSPDLVGVSCAAQSLCVAISDGPTAYLWHDRKWSVAQVLTPGNRLTGISCPTTQLCVAVDSAGNEFRYTGG